MDQIYHKFIRFNQHLLKSSQYTSHPASAIPSAFFVIVSYLFLYRMTHERRLRNQSTWKLIYREVFFHWLCFYLIRFWFWTITEIRSAVEHFEAEFADPPVRMATVGLVAYATLAMLPSILLLYTTFYKSAPNFMYWVGVHRWQRTEMGMSRYYLERPPPLHYINTNKSLLAYRMRRSCSVELPRNVARAVDVRLSKSMYNFGSRTNVKKT